MWSDHDEILGNWKLTSVSEDGRVIYQGMIEDSQPFRFTKDGFVGFWDGKVVSGSYKLDPTATPKSIDMSVEGDAESAIYELQADTLRLAFRLDNEWPTRL